MYPQVLPTITQILALEHLEHLDVESDLDWLAAAASRSPHALGTDPTATDSTQERSLTAGSAIAAAQWTGAIAALNQILAQYVQQAPVDIWSDGTPPMQGLILSSPVPVISERSLATQFATWILRPEPLQNIQGLSLQLPPGDRGESRWGGDLNTLPLIPNDPLATEQFCLVFTPEFNLAFVLGQDGERPVFEFSFDPHLVHKAWQAIQLRLTITSPQVTRQLAQLVAAWGDVTPDYRLVSRFSRGMSQSLSSAAAQRQTAGESATSPLSHHPASGSRPASAKSPVPPRAPAAATPEPATESTLPQDTELLQVMAHEIRTPLTTIRTLTRSLLRRQDLDAKVTKRLRQIDRECTRQIDRFSLIFRAAELETSRRSLSLGSLCATALDQVFHDHIPAWQQQAGQRQIQLDVHVPSGLPLVVSDPTMLTQTLTGLIDRFTHSLPAGSHLQFDVTLAGNQLKLQFISSLQADDPTTTQPLAPCGSAFSPNHAFRAIGQLLMVQPETGNLSLNLAATKNLFQALGGKLVVKQRPQQGEVMTIFLPLSPPDSNQIIV